MSERLPWEEPLGALPQGDGTTRFRVWASAAARVEVELDGRREALEGDMGVFTGRLSHAEVARHVDAMDVAVSPRATFYASPMKILEYMAMKVPVIAPDMPNIRDLFEPEREGLLFEPESVDALRAQLARVCADPALRASLGEAARARVERDRNWLSNAARVEEIARSLLEQR